MKKVVIRDGDDWLTVEVDGQKVIDGHSAAPFHWAEVLRRVGIEVVEEEGNFCEICTEWVPNTTGSMCDKCKEEDAE